MMIDFHICTCFQNYKNILLDQGLLLLRCYHCTVYYPLSRAMTAVLRLFSKKTKAYSDKSTFFSGVKTFWTVLNNQPMIDAIKKLVQGKRYIQFLFLTFQLFIPIQTTTNVNLFCGNQSTSVLKEIQGIYCCYKIQS